MAKRTALTVVVDDAVGLVLTSSSLGDDEREPPCCLARLQLRSTDQSSRHAINICVPVGVAVILGSPDVPPCIPLYIHSAFRSSNFRAGGQRECDRCIN